MIEPVLEQIDDLRFRIKVIYENGTKAWQEVTQEQLALVLKTVDGNSISLGNGLPKLKIDIGDLTNAVSNLITKTGLNAEDINRLVGKGISQANLDKLASKFGVDTKKYKLIEKIIDDQLGNNPDKVSKFITDLSKGLPNSESGLLMLFDEVPNFNVKVWQVLKDGNHTKLINDVVVLRQLNLLISIHPNAEWNKILKFADGSRRLIESLEKLKDKKGVHNILSDLAHEYSGKRQGANFVVEFATSQDEDFIKGIAKFEAYDKDLINGIREYDIQVGVSPNQINIECKAWWKEWNSPNFKEQFIKDLGKMTSLGQIQWRFKKTPNVAPDIITLKDRVLKSLGTWDDVSQKWIAGSELSEMFLEESLRSKIRTVFGSGITDANSFINELGKDNIFKTIFEIVN